MKKWMIVLAVVGLVTNSFAQDTTTVKVGKTKITVIDADSVVTVEADSTDDASVELGFRLSFHMEVGTNGYLTPDGSVNLPKEQSLMELNYGRSRYFAMYYDFKDIKLIKDRVTLRTGLGLSYNGYFFDNNVKIGTDNDTTLFERDTLINYDKYKLRVTYLQIPLMVSFKLNKNDAEKDLCFAAGVIGSYRIGSRIKAKYKVDGDRKKDKIIDDFNFSPFKADATARIGYGNLGLIFNYSLTPLFEKNKAPELYPFSIGISFGGF